ncbi:hypothetical protein LR48_Vigan04g148100 [Vigna angularis]|uniref:Uncharacterized protein n=1 Tax=Phaseolus angularis TaxID=3914 RepID=A0A0L9UEW3_PHAAN|nr:hypothetical protein LR48_Vigan04g148100 [Vigna angularis]
MAIVDVESSLESSGRGDSDGTAGGGDAQPSSPSSVSLSYVERSDPDANVWLVSSVNSSGDVSVAGLPIIWGYGLVPHDVSLHVSDYYMRKQVDDRPVIHRPGYGGRPIDKGGREPSFSDSYKNLKDQYFKVIINESGRGELQDIMSAPPPRQSNFMSSRRETGGGASVSREQVPPPHSRPASINRPPPIMPVGVNVAILVLRAAPGDAVPTPQNPPIIHVEPSLEVAGTSAQPLQRKRKAHKEGDKSASKKNRREGSVPQPLPHGVFSPEFSISHKTTFHMSSTHRSLIKPLSESELTNAMLKMSTRAALLAWYLREFADHRGVEHIQAEMAAEKKVFVNLLAELRLTANQQKEVEKGLHEKNQMLTYELSQAKEKIVKLNVSIIFEHEEGFYKALQQVSVLVGVRDPYVVGFDIEKDVFDRILVHLDDLAARGNPPRLEEPPTAEESKGAEIVVEVVADKEDEDEH